MADALNQAVPSLLYRPVFNDISYPTSLGVIESDQIHLMDVTRHLANQLRPPGE